MRVQTQATTRALGHYATVPPDPGEPALELDAAEVEVEPAQRGEQRPPRREGTHTRARKLEVVVETLKLVSSARANATGTNPHAQVYG